MPVSGSFQAHLDSGVTTLARCWALTRRDGLVLGFTDHDRDLSFAGIDFRAGTGLTAQALQQTTGLAIDNTEALGALSAAAVTEADIRAGRYDGAEVRAWLVNWAAPAQRVLQFRGTLGEIARAGGAFRAELLGLSAALNRAQGRVWQKACPAVVGDRHCGVDLSQALFSGIGLVQAVDEPWTLVASGFDAFAEGWFAGGMLHVETGAAAGLSGLIRTDRGISTRRLGLWEGLRAGIAPGDTLRLTAGCDKSPQACRLKFDNMVNFRGFPDIPGDDALMQVPVVASGSGGAAK